MQIENILIPYCPAILVHYTIVNVIDQLCPHVKPIDGFDDGKHDADPSGCANNCFHCCYANCTSQADIGSANHVDGRVAACADSQSETVGIARYGSDRCSAGDEVEHFFSRIFREQRGVRPTDVIGMILAGQTGP